MDSSLVVMDNSSKTIEDSDDREEPLVTVYIVPTSHISKKSSEDVTNTIHHIKPDVVAVELDGMRLKRLKSKDLEESNSNKSLWKLLRSRKFSIRGAMFIFSLSLLQQKLSSKLGIGMSGIDMLAGVNAAEENEIPLALVDQPIEKTITKFVNSVSIGQLLQFVSISLYSYIRFSLSTKESIESQMDHTEMDIPEILETMEEHFPQFKKVFIDDRDSVISEKTIALSQEYSEIVLVIGAGHKPGVKQRLSEEDHISIQEPEILDNSE